MKKKNFLFALLGILLISGCNRRKKSTDIFIYPNNVAPHYISSLEDVVVSQGELRNKERFEEFLHNVEKRKEDRIRVVRNATEGYQLVRDLEYDGEIFKSTSETHGWKEALGRTIITCTSIKVIETKERTEYILEGCKHPIDNMILEIEKD